jgi:hypothetical protein
MPKRWQIDALTGENMTQRNVHTIARQAASALIREAREAGWLRARFEIKPDGSVTVDAGMVEPDSNDEFLNGDLRMRE